MYKLKKIVRISGAHYLREYKGPCARMHGHNWKITVHLQSAVLGNSGMVLDFSTIKEIVNEYDHKCLNDIAPFDMINPTAENMASVLFEKFNAFDSPMVCTKVEVEETEGSVASYEI